MGLQATKHLGIAALLMIVMGLAMIAGEWIAGDSTPVPRTEPAAEIPARGQSVIDDDALGRINPELSLNADGAPPREDGLNVSGVPVIDLNSITGFQEILDRMGIERDVAEWDRSLGFVWVPEVGFHWDNPYEDLSVAELEALVEAGDEDAKLALAMAIAESDPAAAVDLYYGLAVDGNPEAMIGMVNAYGHMEYALESPGELGIPPPSMEAIEGLTALGVDPEIESLAWLYVVNSFTGQPRTSAGDIPDDMWPALVRACDRAVELWQQIGGELAAEGRSIPALVPAPFGQGSLDMGNMLMEACPPERLPTADFSRCRAIKIYDQGHTYDGFVCP